MKTYRLLSLVLIAIITFIPGCSHSTQQIQAIASEQSLFSVVGLHAEPLIPQPAETFSISIIVISSGDTRAVYDAVMDIVELDGKNEIKVATFTKSLPISARSSETIIFEQMHMPEGIYRMVVGNLESILEVSCT